MKQDIDKLINSSSAYKTKLSTAVSNLSSYLNTLNNYINPSYTSGGSYLAPKLSNLNSQMSSLISNIKSRIQNNLGGSVSANNLQAIYTALGNVNMNDVHMEIVTTSSRTQRLTFSKNISSYDNYIISGLYSNSDNWPTSSSYAYIKTLIMAQKLIDDANLSLSASPDHPIWYFFTRGGSVESERGNAITVGSNYLSTAGNQLMASGSRYFTAYFYNQRGYLCIFWND